VKNVRTLATCTVVKTRMRTPSELSSDSSKDPAMYEVLYKGVATIKFEDEEIVEDVTLKCKSYVDLPPGRHEVVITEWKRDVFSKPIRKIRCLASDYKQKNDKK